MTADPSPEALRRALEREYRLDAVVQEDAAGAVYLAHDLVLNRRVVIKAISPAVAGPARTEAFEHEARVLAALSHPNVPSVHHAGSIAGFLHVVVEDPGAETLERRLRQGKLSLPEVLRFSDQLLGALGAVHAAGFAHRDVTDAHVFVTDGRYVLDGFGRAGRAVSEDDAPDDLRAAALLISRSAIEPGRDISSLPRRLRSPLQRGLSPDPAVRWRSASEFRAALLLPRPPWAPRRRLAWIAGLAVAVAAGISAARGWIDPPPAWPTRAARELAILPFEVDGGPGLDPLGSTFAPLIQVNLDGMPGLRLTSGREVERWWEEQGREGPGLDWTDAARDLRVHWVARGLMDRRPGDLLRVRLTLYDSLGNRSVLPEVRGPARDLAALGDSVTLQIIRVVAPRADSLYEPVAGLASVPLPALKAFLRGEAAFARDAWALAERQYEIALGHDSTFALAEWRLSNVRRWRRLPYEVDLRALFRRQAARFRESDRLIIEALLEPDLEVRFAGLEAAVARRPFNGYARLLHGEELFHRGPLVGRGLDQATEVMKAAVGQDPSLALAYDHLVLAAVRLGRREEADIALAARRRSGRSASSEDLDLVPFLELVYHERFVPWRAWLRHRYLVWRASPQQLDGVAKVARMGTPWLDMPRTQLRYSDLLLRAVRPSAETYATAHEGKGLAYFALGRLREAFAELDSAAALVDAPDARLEQAEWRVIPPALGLPEVESGDWIRQLEELAGDPALGARAAWALALAAQAAKDTALARRWTARLEPGTALRGLLEAREAALRGDLALALARTDSIRLAFQVTRPPDIFAGAAFHLLRGDWLAAMGQGARADREWLWYEASDVEGWPAGLAQAGEVDAALGVFARLKRARVLLAGAGSGGSAPQACIHLGRVVEHWSGADSLMQPLVREASALRSQCPR